MSSDGNPEEILSIASTLAQEAWDISNQPFMLSDLSPALARKGIDYRKVIGGQRLKGFLEGAREHVKVVVHPTQDAKVGLIPPGETFEFPQESQSAPKSTNAHRDRGGASRRKYIVLNFLELLAELDDESAGQVQLPTHVLMKLMREK